MFKPTKKQHIVNKNYVDQNGGFGGGGTEPLIVRLNVDTLDKTWQEIFDAMPNVIIDSSNAETGYYNRKLIDEVFGGAEVDYAVASGENFYTTTSASGYPVQGVN